MRKKWLLVFIAIVVLSVILGASACTASGAREPKTQVIDVYMGEVKSLGLEALESLAPDEAVLVAEFHRWVPDVIIVSKGDTVQLNITNPRSGVHSFAIPELGIETGPLAPRGGTETIEFIADEAGTFGFKCDIPWDPDTDPRNCDADHEFMTGTLIVLDV